MGGAYKILGHLRSNVTINKIIRNLIRGGFKHFSNYSWVANRFRVYGVVRLPIHGVDFKMYAEGDDYIVNELYYQLNYELEEFLLVKELCLRSTHFIDVGANTGIFSIYNKVSNPILHVIALEPHPGNFKRLIRNINLNAVQVDGRQLAAGDQNSLIRFTVPSDESIATTASANNGFATNFKDTPHKEIEVAQVTLDSLFHQYQLSWSDVIKIDVEYYEKEVLLGLKETLTSVKPFVILEILDYDSLIEQFPAMSGRISPTHSDDIHSFMASMGYFAYEVMEDGIQIVQVEERRSNRRNFLFAPTHFEKFIPWGKILESLPQPVNTI